MSRVQPKTRLAKVATFYTFDFYFGVSVSLPTPLRGGIGWVWVIPFLIVTIINNAIEPIESKSTELKKRIK